MAAKDNLNNDQFFETHLNAFKQQTGVELVGTNLIVNDNVIPTVRQHLTAKQKNGKTAYYLEASVLGDEGNLHDVMVTTLTGKPFYGLALSRNTGKENLDTHDVNEFSNNMNRHLQRARTTPPSTDGSENAIGMSDKAVVMGYLDEWHRRGVLNATQVQDWDANRTVTKTYDPVTGKYI